MKHRRYGRIATACALLTAALLLPGCGPADSAAEPPASSGAQQSSPVIQTAPAYQDDGKLRLLYGTDYGGSIVFRGITPLHQASARENLWLVEDVTGKNSTCYATGTSSEDGTWEYRLYNSTGSLVYFCGGESPQHLLGDWLLLTYDSIDVSYAQKCRFVNLKTGENRDLTMESVTMEALDTGGYLLSGWREDSIPCSVLLDETLQPLATFDSSQLFRPYRYDACGWLELNRRVEGPYGGYAFERTLYNPSTGEELTNSIELVGNGAACLQNEDGSYSLYDLAAGAEIARGWQRYLMYHQGIVVTAEQDGATLRDNDGLVYAVEDYDLAEDGTLVVRSRSYTAARVYDGSGALLYTRKNVGGDQLEALSGGRFLATVYNWQQPERSFSTLYGPDDLLFQTEKGSYVTQHTDDYLVVTRLSYAGSYRYDLYDWEGNLLIESLSGLPGQLEEVLIPARRGFTLGWMDRAGNWLWSQRVFTSVNDERDYSWY